MEKFLVGSLLVLAFVCTSGAVDDAQNNSSVGPCDSVFCTNGRMCVASEDLSTTCVCPESCPDTMEPVCSMYHREFNNTCQMYKFSCHYGFFTAVKHKGRCTVQEMDSMERGCPLDRLLDFHDRYLDWIMIANEAAKAPDAILKHESRIDSLIDQERQKLVKWEFTFRDINKDDLLDKEEVKFMVDEREACMVALLEACDFDGELGISLYEWDTCFPIRLKGLERRIAQEAL